VNDRDLEGFFSRIGNAMKKSGNFAFNRVKQCANNLACRNAVLGLGKAALGAAVGKK
jgi:hypothetical protein